MAQKMLSVAKILILAINNVIFAVNYHRFDAVSSNQKYSFDINQFRNRSVDNNMN